MSSYIYQLHDSSSQITSRTAAVLNHSGIQNKIIVLPSMSLFLLVNTHLFNTKHRFSIQALHLSHFKDHRAYLYITLYHFRTFNFLLNCED